MVIQEDLVLRASGLRKERYVERVEAVLKRKPDMKGRILQNTSEIVETTLYRVIRRLGVFVDEIGNARSIHALDMRKQRLPVHAVHLDGKRSV